jgi:SNF2 family DNA or RNA helicase
MAWRAPLTSSSEAIAWANSFDVLVSPEVHGVSASIGKKLDELKEASRSTDADIEVPLLQGTLLPYQRAGVESASKARRSFIADEMGLGKTIQAIATLEYSSKDSEVYPVVVVCPPSLVLNWKSEWNRWLPHRRVAVVTNRREIPEPRTYDVLVVGYSNISHWEKQLLAHNSYIFDESHYAKSPTAQRTKSAIKMAKSAPKHGIVLCLTGTPVTNRPAEYASQLDIIGKLKEFGGLWGFYRRYCSAFQDRFGQWNINGHSHLDELNDRLRGTCYIRRTKSQVLSELPPVIHSQLVVEGTEAGLKEYRKAEQDIIKYITDRAKEIAIELGESPYSAAVVARIKAESNEHLVRLSVLRRLSAKAKMPMVEEWVQSRIDDGKKVVVAAHHRDIVDELARKFGNLRIQGGMSVEEVEAQKARFQDEPVETAPVIVLSIQAAKTGHTLTSAQDILFVELPWTPSDLDQTFSRLHRIGQKGSVTATYMLTDNTIDQEIYALIEKKRKVVNAATEGGEFAASGGATQLVLDLLNRHR